jgi:hypothetical protein
MSDRRRKSSRSSSKSVLTIPKRASARATRLQGRSRGDTGMGNGGNMRKQRVQNTNLIITITQNQSRMIWEMRYWTSAALSARGGGSMIKMSF